MLPFVPLVMGALPHLKKYWKEIAIVGIIGLAAYQNFSETRFLLWIETIPSLENRLEQAEANIETCRAGNVALEDSINKRNTEIAQWKEVSEKNAATIAALEGDLASARQATNTTVANVLKDPTPKTCEAAIKYLREGAGDIKW